MMIEDDMMEKKHYNVVCAVVIDKGEVLCMQKGQTKFPYTSYHWEFPGGKIEGDESPEEALHRELLEEMEYDVRMGEHLTTVEHEYPDFSITMAAYICTASTRELVRKEHADHRWLSVDEMALLDWCAADRPIVEFIAHSS